MKIIFISKKAGRDKDKENTSNRKLEKVEVKELSRGIQKVK